MKMKTHCRNKNACHTLGNKNVKGPGSQEPICKLSKRIVIKRLGNKTFLCLQVWSFLIKERVMLKYIDKKNIQYYFPWFPASPTATSELQFTQFLNISKIIWHSIKQVNRHLLTQSNKQKLKKNMKL